MNNNVAEQYLQKYSHPLNLLIFCHIIITNFPLFYWNCNVIDYFKSVHFSLAPGSQYFLEKSFATIRAPNLLGHVSSWFAHLKTLNLFQLAKWHQCSKFCHIFSVGFRFVFWGIVTYEYTLIFIIPLLPICMLEVFILQEDDPLP